MKVTLENTSKLVHLNGVPARVWEGETESGIKVHAFITRIAVEKSQDTSQFERELSEQKVPSAEVQAIPLRMIL
ncbi:MAG: hypothetical protein ACJ749_17630 [Flavisolibacter sp.]|jgi:hypothetical protein